MAAFRTMLNDREDIRLKTLNPYIEHNRHSYFWKSDYRKDLYDFTRKSYTGGRTEIFKMKGKNLYYYDFNSLYPHICVKNQFPHPDKFFVIDDCDIKYFNSDIRDKLMYIIEATVYEKDKYPILGIKYEDSLRFFRGKKTGVWCSTEFQRFLKKEENHLIKIHKIRVYYETHNIFDFFFETLYYDRLKAKKKGLVSEAYRDKIIMNSLTGKFGQNPIREGWTLATEEMLNSNQLLDNPKEVIHYTLVSMIKQEIELLKDYMLIEYSSFITSDAKGMIKEDLIDLIVSLGGEVYYCDTDSIFCDIPLEIYKPEMINEKLGGLKNELIKNNWVYNPIKKGYIDEKGEFHDIPKIEEARFYGCKTYAYKKDGKINLVAKGISYFMLCETLGIDKIRGKETEEQIDLLLKDFKTIEKLLQEGLFETRFYKYKQSLRLNKELTTFGTITKTLRKVYDKRKILENGIDTIPFSKDEFDKYLEDEDIQCKPFYFDKERKE